MKKHTLFALLSVLLIAAMLFGGCGKNKTGQKGAAQDAQNNGTGASVRYETTTVDYAPIINRIYGTTKPMPSVQMASDAAQEVKAGDTFSVSVTLQDAQNVAAFDFELHYDEKVLTVEKTEGYDNPNVIMLENAGQEKAKEVKGTILFSGITATTVDMSGDKLFTVTFSVNKGASAGPSDVKLVCTQFLVGTDETGDETADLISVKNLDSTFTVTVS